jgi:hypothetical protein
MERKKTAELEVYAVHYDKTGGLLLALPSQKARLDALETCDDEGGFNLKYAHNHEGRPGETIYRGRITRVFFLGERPISQAERDDNSPTPIKAKNTVESGSYSFDQWKEAGRPLRVRLDITETFSKIECV